MKTISLLTLGIYGFLLFSLSGCDSETVIPVEQLSENETIGLEYMREEEKLARDVYITLFEMHDNQTFSNISKSEQRHMDQLLVLLNEYDITDPSLVEVGQFSNEILQKLYDELITQGSDSEIMALIVGATIEDLDIKDLEDYKTTTTNQDIIATYNSLLCGSRNHLRSFISQLESNDESYTPQFISQEEFDSIISGEKERCGQMNN